MFLHSSTLHGLRKRSCYLKYLSFFYYFLVVHDIEEIADTICVGQYNAIGDGRAVLFVKMKNGYSFDADILKKIETTILQELTVFYIPQVILPVKDIPVSTLQNLNMLL